VRVLFPTKKIPLISCLDYKFAKEGIEYENVSAWIKAIKVVFCPFIQKAH
jgi:hypothetical protein